MARFEVFRTGREVVDPLGMPLAVCIPTLFHSQLIRQFWQVGEGWLDLWQISASLARLRFAPGLIVIQLTSLA